LQNQLSFSLTIASKEYEAKKGGSRGIIHRVAEAPGATVKIQMQSKKHPRRAAVAENKAKYGIKQDL
jgi:hypothetical protein